MRILKLLEHSRLYCISLKDTLYVPRPCGETLENTARAGGRGVLEVLLCPVERSGYFVNGNKVFQMPSA